MSRPEKKGGMTVVVGSSGSNSSAKISLLDDFYEEEEDVDASNDSQQQAATPKRTSAVVLRGNLTRTMQRNRDPLFYYEIVSVLGVGSMGSVARVRKRRAVVGGSARPEVVRHYRQQRCFQTCFELPLGLGKLFQFCFKRTADHANEAFSKQQEHSSSFFSGGGRGRGASSVVSVSTSSGDESSVIHTQARGRVEDYNDPEYQRRGGGGATAGAGAGDIIYAMKSIHLSRVTDPQYVDELKNEIAILKRLDHPHIVKAMETFEFRNQIFIVMELCGGGDLYSRDPYTEPEAARIVTSIVSAIAYMHSRNVIHRDLKYENILFVNTSPQAEVKLIDFGLSAKWGSGEELTEGVGTIYTMAPEVLKGSYTKQADLWSVGVIAFMLMSSQMPFYGRKRRHIVEQIMQGKYEFKGRRWRRISNQAKDFINELLVVDPDDRADAEQALSMAWLNRRFTATVRNPYEEEMESAAASIIKYSKYAKIKKIALLVCAHKSTTAEIGILRKVFQKYDTQGDGQLSYQEFKDALCKDAGYSEEEYRAIFDAVDLDGTGKIRYTEFLAATIEAHGAISEERLAEAFDRLDSDDSGYISAANLKELLGKNFPEEEIAAIIDEADISRDGRISYSEFLALWQDKNESVRAGYMEEIIQLGAVGSNRSTDSEEDSSCERQQQQENYDPVARANFLERKISSERQRKNKAAAGAAAASEARSCSLSGDPNNGISSTKTPKPHKVFFEDAIQTIPTPIYSLSDNSSNMAAQGDAATAATAPRNVNHKTKEERTGRSTPITKKKKKAQ